MSYDVIHLSQSFEFQDDLGGLIAEVCETIPHGILCFLPSYKMLDKLSQRWKSTGLFQRLEMSKTVLMEPKAVDRTEFDYVIKQFYTAIEGNEGLFRLSDVLFFIHFKFT
jgi:Fanconi anemia group J protein